MVAFVYAFIIGVAIYPLVFGWTLGLGFLYRLGMVDVSGTCAIHLVAGFASLFGAWQIGARQGRFEPLAIKKVIQSNEIYLQSDRKFNVEAQIEWYAKELHFNDKVNPDKYVSQIRKLLENTDNDSFFTMNSPICVFIGTMVMWLSLCHMYSSYWLSPIS